MVDEDVPKVWVDLVKDGQTVRIRVGNRTYLCYRSYVQQVFDGERKEVYAQFVPERTDWKKNGKAAEK